MAINYFEKPFFLAAVISALILYSPSFKKLQEKKLHSLIKIEDISKIQGKIKSSPVKNSSGSYSADFEVYYAKDNKNSWSEARGKIKIFIPYTHTKLNLSFYKISFISIINQYQIR